MKENPNDVAEGKDYTDFINPKSIEVLRNCRVEPGLAGMQPGDRFQFECLGYFCVDAKDSTPDAIVFNRTTTLRDTWAKIMKAQKKIGN